MSSPKPALSNPDLPAGAHVRRADGLQWLKRVYWTAADYEFIADQYRRLAKAHLDIADIVDAERDQRYRGT